MWDKAVTWLLAFLALASSAGWLASRRTRSLRRLMGESDLLANLPAGEAREALEKHISTSVHSYLRERDAQERAQLWMLGATVAQLVALTMLVVADFGGAGMLDDWDKAPLWATLVAATAATIMVASVVLEATLVLRGVLAVRGDEVPPRARRRRAR